ncbi:MAG: hypothetical protein FIA99_03960 [Ruminiclostridium sp.]|nr:hypothetical protein [Ruminiclostridium sp.]
MYSYRVSKYNPIFRDEKGSYKNDGWTSFADIGIVYDNREFLIDEYISVENAYVQAINSFINCLEVPSMKIVSLEKNYDSLEIDKYPDNYSKRMISLYSSIKEGSIIKISDIECLSRLILREHLWCKLEHSSIMFVHFGYDYYLYLGSSKRCEGSIEEITKSGLFVEEFESPYTD